MTWGCITGRGLEENTQIQRDYLPQSHRTSDKEKNKVRVLVRQRKSMCLKLRM